MTRSKSRVTNRKLLEKIKDESRKSFFKDWGMVAIALGGFFTAFGLSGAADLPDAFLFSGSCLFLSGFLFVASSKVYLIREHWNGKTLAYLGTLSAIVGVEWFILHLLL